MPESSLSHPEHDNENESSLFDIFLPLWRYKIPILVISLCAVLAVATYSIISLRLPPEESFLPNLYTSRADMLIDNAAVINAVGLGGLARMAGLNATSGPIFSSLAVYLVNSDTMLDSVVEQFDLITRYKIKEHIIANSRKALKEKLKTEYKNGTGVLPSCLPITTRFSPVMWLITALII